MARAAQHGHQRQTRCAQRATPALHAMLRSRGFALARPAPRRCASPTQEGVRIVP